MYRPYTTYPGTLRQHYQTIVLGVYQEEEEEEKEEEEKEEKEEPGVWPRGGEECCSPVPI
ncbi:hypothetical protein SAMD00023353_0600290 [Rosellinia necatrix]|uniref:Uncharacterized protein n=1 Tax=Rosellinia necatrix TaxID=77044 RepID=A0A1S8A5R5_ROSNE|nr:hypothetical protein SAMD00023353_0600290 [Rosellinia necatrix]